MHVSKKAIWGLYPHQCSNRYTQQGLWRWLRLWELLHISAATDTHSKACGGGYVSGSFCILVQQQIHKARPVEVATSLGALSTTPVQQQIHTARPAEVVTSLGALSTLVQQQIHTARPVEVATSLEALSTLVQQQIHTARPVEVATSLGALSTLVQHQIHTDTHSKACGGGYVSGGFIHTSAATDTHRYTQQGLWRWLRLWGLYPH